MLSAFTSGFSFENFLDCGAADQFLEKTVVPPRAKEGDAFSFAFPLTGEEPTYAAHWFARESTPLPLRVSVGDVKSRPHLVVNFSGEALGFVPGVPIIAGRVCVCSVSAVLVDDMVTVVGGLLLLWLLCCRRIGWNAVEVGCGAAETRGWDASATPLLA